MTMKPGAWQEPKSQKRQIQRKRALERDRKQAEAHARARQTLPLQHARRVADPDDASARFHDFSDASGLISDAAGTSIATVTAGNPGDHFVAVSTREDAIHDAADHAYRAVQEFSAAVAAVKVEASPVRISPMTTRLLTFVAIGLPSASRERYTEEWHGELHDDRAEGLSWSARTGTLLRILRRAPALAFTLRAGKQRAVE
jgi:hypothetical protein